MNSRTIEALKKLAVKITSATKTSDVTGDTVDEVIEYIAENITVTISTPPSV